MSLHWLDNADSWICPVCGFETSSPAKYEGCKCPRCVFQDDKDKTESEYSEMTEREKADRFDALQAAFRITRDNYIRLREDADLRYTEASVIGAYNKGLADGYGRIIDDLERWIV
jgi:hypothetical protein